MNDRFGLTAIGPGPSRRWFFNGPVAGIVHQPHSFWYRMQPTRHFFALILLAFAQVIPVQVYSAVVIPYDSIHHPELATDGMVVSQRTIASEVGADILRQGGNAVDAAVATGFALAVVLPRAGNLGGGGFMLIHLAEGNRTIALDFRETAPSAATSSLFLNEFGEVDTQLARRSLKATAVPGSVAGLIHALERYGTMTLSQVMAPAVQLASKGFVLPPDTASALRQHRQLLKQHTESAAIFYKPRGAFYDAGEKLVQKDLAGTLRLISRRGRDGFYAGPVADRIVELMEKEGGLITREDLSSYSVIERQPLQAVYRAWRIVTMPPPSSGGVHLIQMLNVLSHFPLRRYGAGGADSIHILAEAMKQAYADRSRHLGDPAFHDVPVTGLTSTDYAKRQVRQIDLNRAREAAEIAPAEFGEWGTPGESPDTTHFSVADRFGNAVSCTTTLNFPFGNGYVVPGTGVLLNNEMDDFAARTNAPNAYGLLGGEANAIAAGKRPLSSMSPTLVFKNEDLLLVTGSPGGGKIISTVLQFIVNVLDHGMNIADATHAPRVHHQWQPDELLIEPGVSPDTLVELRRRGHVTRQSESQGSLQSIRIDGELFHGAADPRRPGAGAVGVSAP